MRTIKDKDSNYIDFNIIIENFFMKNLIAEAGASSHTIRSYRDTIILWLEYITSSLKIKIDKVSLKYFNSLNIIGFLEWLETEKGNSVRTRNQRLAAIRSITKYILPKDPAHIKQWSDILAIKKKKGVTKNITYLSTEEVKFLFEQIDCKERQGRRDFCLLLLLYSTGMRVTELTSATVSSIRFEKPSSILIMGKGKKERQVPLNQDLCEMLLSYIQENGLNASGKEQSPLFPNKWGENMTTPGITFILQKYSKLAHAKDSARFTKPRLTPHILRHSKAMHLLQQGVNIIYIRDFLGHSYVQTTEIYAKADAKSKREALEQAYLKVGIDSSQKGSWESNSKLKEFLKSLS